VVVAGGMESMTRRRSCCETPGSANRLGNGELVDSTVADGLWCGIEDCHMGTHAERVAIKDQVSREDQDAFALESHRRAIAAIDEGRFEAELAPVTIRDAKGRETVIGVDESPRRDTTIEPWRASSRRSTCPMARIAATQLRAPSRGQAPGITDGAGGHGCRQRADRGAAWAEATRPDRRYAQAEVAPKWLFLAPSRAFDACSTGSSCPWKPSTDRDQRGIRGADACRWARELVSTGQR